MLNFSTFLHAPVFTFSETLFCDAPSGYSNKNEEFIVYLTIQCQPISFFIPWCLFLFPMWWYSNVANVEYFISVVVEMWKNKFLTVCIKDVCIHSCATENISFQCKRIEFPRHEFILIFFLCVCHAFDAIIPFLSIAVFEVDKIKIRIKKRKKKRISRTSCLHWDHKKLD